MLLQISVTKIHGISERFALIIKYLGNVADGDKDLTVVQTQLGGASSFPDASHWQ
jgi:hypothetical protein